MSQQKEDRNFGYKRNEYPTNTNVDEYLLPVGTEVIMAGTTDEYATWRTLGVVKRGRSEGKDVARLESISLPTRGVVVDRFHDGMAWRTHWDCFDDNNGKEIRSSAWESCRQLLHEVLDGRMNSEVFYRRIVGWDSEFAQGNHRSPLKTCYRVRYVNSPYGVLSAKLVDAGFMMPIDGNDWDIYSSNYSYDVVLAYRDSEGEWVDTEFIASDAISKTHPEHLEWLKSQPTIMALQKPTDAEIESNVERWKDDFVEYPDFHCRTEMSVVAKSEKEVSDALGE
jgi:hypothetical protein